ncbi:hypothetical protein KC347_g187 [Hortaea werneckii]|nr:hypothetical protein KC347_g187 [Hortaea werneckii]
MLNDIVLTTVTLIIGGPTPRQNARMPSALYASFTSRGKATKVDSTLLVDAAISVRYFCAHCLASLLVRLQIRVLALLWSILDLTILGRR